MKLNHLTSFKYQRSTGGSFQHNTSHGIMNGLLLSYPSSNDADSITIKMRGEKGLISICSRLPLRVLQEMSDYYFGASGLGASRQITKAIYAIQTAGALTVTQANDAFDAIAADAGEMRVNSICLPLGSLYLNGKYELDIEVETALSGTDATVHTMDIVTYSNEKSPAFNFTYDISHDLESSIRGAKEVYVMPRDLTKRINQDIKDVNIQIDYEDEDTALFDLSHSYLAYRMFGSFESDPFGVLVNIFEDESTIPSDIHLKLTGADAAMLSVLTVRKRVELNSILENTNKELDKRIRKTEKLEREDPEMAKALRMTGDAVKSEVLEEVKANATKPAQKN